jgi:hypothetical protein
MTEQDLKQDSKPQVPIEAQDAEAPSHSPQRINLVGRLTWSLVLVWVGSVLLVENLGYLASITLSPVSLPWAMPIRATVWRLLLIGTGGLLALGVVMRLLIPRFRDDVLGNLILVIVCVALGLGYVNLIWPLILIAIGIALLVKRGFF